MAKQDFPPRVRRLAVIRNVAFGLVVIWFWAALLLSEKPLVIGRTPLVMQGQEMPARILPPDYLDSLDQYGLHQIKLGHPPLIGGGRRTFEAVGETAPRGTPTRLGYSIVETDIIGMPFWYTRNIGPVIYYETKDEFVCAPVTDDYFRQLKIPAPRLDSLHWPWWNHIWGWLYVLALAATGWLAWRVNEGKREALGII